MSIPAEWPAAIFVFLRCYGFLLAFSTLRQQLGPLQVFTLAAALAAGAPEHAAVPVTLAGFPPALALAAFWELAAGFVLALPFSFLASFIISSGRLADLFRGNLLAEQLLPGLEERASALEAALALGLTAAVFASGAWQLPVTLLYGGLLQPGPRLLEGCFSPEAVTSLLRFAASSFAQSVLLLAPALLIVLVFELIVLGLGRAQPRLHIPTELSGLKLLLGLAALGACSFEGDAWSALWARAGTQAAEFGRSP